MKWYRPKNPCPECKTFAVRRCSDGMCTGCFPHVMDEKLYDDARSWDRKLYMPTGPCSVCGRVARRETKNNRCTHCLGVITDETLLMMENAPDTVLSLLDAMRLNLRVFRTGLPGNCGHTGFKLVPTRECIDCVRGK